MHSNELEYIREALNLMAEGIHTSHVFLKQEFFVHKTSHLRCFNGSYNVPQISRVIK